MKHESFVKARYFIVFSFVVLLLACHKLDWDDLWHKHNPDCRIERITYKHDDFADSVVGNFSYNHKGDPVSVLFNYVSTARPQFQFRYDKKGRLTDFIGYYSDTHPLYEFWYNYQYNDQGQIIIDSQSVFGSWVNGNPVLNPELRSYGNYEYDGWGRVVKETRFTFVPPGSWLHWSTREFIYNADGNLGEIRSTSGGSTSSTFITGYDNKVNISRTHKIWMFLNRDYSRNNAKAAVQYNRAGLPTKFRFDDPFARRFIYEINLMQSDIEYHCK